VFNEWADIGGYMREQIAPKAFRKTIREADVPFVFNHDDSTVMARTSNKRLKLSEDERGLYVEAQLDPTDADAAKLITKLEAKNVTKMSFAFQTVRDDWDESTTPLPSRTLREVKLYDVSPVTNPAYTGTDAQIRAEARMLLEARGIAVPSDDADEFAAALEVITTKAPDEADPAQVREAIDTLLRYVAAAEPDTEVEETEAVHSLTLDTAQRRLQVARHRMQLLGVA
jgi:HK97 family phage prohead protease